MTRNGINDASSDPLELAEMFGAHPGCNVGLATGRESGVVVLDSDSWNGGGPSLARLQQEHGKLPSTRLHQTGSSDLHWCFAYPEGVEWLPSRTIAPGVELKADGAGVVLPPSRHPSGAWYVVLIDGPLAPLPSWIVEKTRRLQVVKGGGQPGQSRYRLPERIREGTRNDTLHRYGCSLRAHGWDYAEILEELRRVNAERCVPPLSDDEVRKIAASAASHEPGNASTATPETLEALDGIEDALWARPWPGVGGKSERSVMVSLVKVARRHGTLIPAGVRVSIATRSLAAAAGMPHRSLMRTVGRLRRSGLIRKDDADRRPAEAGAFVLVYACYACAYCHHSTTSSSPSEGRSSSRATDSTSDDTLRAVAPFTAPRLRWGYWLGKTNEAIVDTLEGAGGEMRLGELADALGVKRSRDLRRRNLSRLEDANVVEVERREGGEIVRLRPGWLEALERERTLTGEKKAEEDDRRWYDVQQQWWRKHVAEKRRAGRKGTGEHKR